VYRSTRANVALNNGTPCCLDVAHEIVSSLFYVTAIRFRGRLSFVLALTHLERRGRSYSSVEFNEVAALSAIITRLIGVLRKLCVQNRRAQEVVRPENSSSGMG